MATCDNKSPLMVSPIKPEQIEHLSLSPWQQKPKVKGFQSFFRAPLTCPRARYRSSELLSRAVSSPTDVHVQCTCRCARADGHTHHPDAVSDGLGRQVAAELGPDHPAVAVCSGHLPPDHSGLVGFATRSHRVSATKTLFRAARHAGKHSPRCFKHRTRQQNNWKHISKPCSSPGSQSAQ